MISVYRKLDSLGRVVIPKQLLNKYNISSRDILEISENEHGTIVILPQKTGCAFCGSHEKLIRVQSRYLCTNCLHEAQEQD